MTFVDKKKQPETSLECAQGPVEALAETTAPETAPPKPGQETIPTQPPASPQNGLRDGISQDDAVVDGSEDTPQPADETSVEETDDSTKNTKNPEYITGLHFYVVFGALILSSLLFALNSSMLGTATPSITNHFHSIQDVGWYGSSYLISNCAMLPLTGQIFAIFPLKPTFLTFVAIFELGSLISGVATSSSMLIIGRAVSGIGGSGMMTGITGVVTLIRPLAQRPLLIGVIMGCVAVGQVAGPLLGGILSQVTWRWIFFINLPIGAITIVVFVVFVHLPPPPGQAALPDPSTSRAERYQALLQRVVRIDFIGFVVFAAGCALLLMGLQWGGTTHPWKSGQVIGLICAGVVLLGIFGGWSQHKGDGALLPFRLLRHSTINVFCGITALTQSASVFVLMFYLPIWFQGIKGATPIISGVMLMPTILSQLVASVLCGFLVQKTGYYLPEVVIGNSLVALASGLFTTFRPDTSTGKWIGYQILGGAGRGFVMQILVTVIQANVPPADIPIGISYVMFAQYFGGAIFICVARTVLTSTLSTNVAKYVPHINPKIIIDTGVTELRKVVPQNDLAGVILAYNSSIVDIFYLQLALSGFALICSCFLGWRDVRKVQPAAKVPDIEKDTKKEDGDDEKNGAGLL